MFRFLKEDTSVLTATPTQVKEGTIGEKTGLQAVTGAVIGLFKEGNVKSGVSIVAAIIVLVLC